MAPRKSGGSYRGPARGERGQRELTALFEHWKAGAPGFARPAPPPDSPLPLKFTCRGCGGTVDPATGRCGGCQALYDL